MIRSMTAFARVQKHIESGYLCWEIRSVNHRYLDASFRLPESFRFIEPQLRSSLRGKIARGKLECQLKHQDTSSNNQAMLIDIGMVNALVNLSSQLASSHNLADDMTASRILSWPGVVHANQVDMEDLGQNTVSLFHEAIDQLTGARAVEGAALKEHIEKNLQALQFEVSRSEQLAEKLAVQVKDKLLTRLHEVQLEVAEQRVEQEIALILARLDVREELDRLKTHCADVSRALNNNKSAEGKRLDFVMQELNREANTLSSKSDSVELTQSAIEMKVLIEQMREQIQNIE